MEKLKKFLSRKLFIAILTPVLIAANSHLSHPIAPDVLKYLIGLFALYIFGQAAQDTIEAGKNR